MRQLLASDGWRLYAQHIDAKYGAARYRERIQAAMKAADPANDVRSVEIGATFAEYFLRWPEKRLAELDRPTAPATLRRGGY